MSFQVLSACRVELPWLAEQGRLARPCPSTQVSADDFLGQCEVEFASVADVAEADAQLRWLPLYGLARGGRRVGAGEIQVAIWCEAAGGAGEHGEPSRRACTHARCKLEAV